MVITPRTISALMIMYAVHRWQKDKAGEPYWKHPLKVASSMEDEETTVVALLHDVVEDYGKVEPHWDGFAEMMRQLRYCDDAFHSALEVCSFLARYGSPIDTNNLERIINAGDKSSLFEGLCKELNFCPAEREALSLLTHDKDKDSYGSYIKKVSTNLIATKVKLADLEHNSDVSRLPVEERKTKDTKKRCRKYRAAMTYLKCSLEMNFDLEISTPHTLVKKCT